MTSSLDTGNIPHMTDTTLIERIEQRLADMDLSANDACIRAGIDRDTIRDLKRGKRRTLTIPTVRRLAAVLNVATDWLSGEDVPAEPEEVIAAGGTVVAAPVATPDVAALPNTIPVLGTAAGAAIGAFVIDGAIDWVRRPPGLANTRNVYALYVAGESMVPKFNPGDLIFVSPDRPSVAGDTVVIQTRTHTGAPLQAWIKTIVRRTHGGVVARQLNPPAEIEYLSHQIVAVHRVLTMRELFGI